MANRHKAHKAGGGATKSRDDYSGTGEPNVVKEAKSEKNYKGGGKVFGNKGKHRIKKAHGGAVFSSAGGGSASTNPMGCTAGRRG